MVGPDGSGAAEGATDGTTDDGFEVNRADLTRHAADVHRFAARVGKAGTIAETVGLGGMNAYGVLCSPLLIPALQSFFGDTRDMIRGLAELGHACADGVRTSEGNYATAEEALHSRIGGIE